MRIKNAIHGSELQSYLADDLKRQALASPAPAGNPSQAVNKAVSTAKAKEWLQAAQEAAGEVGQMPPEPPTLRARAGSVVVQLVRRMVFWLTPQINSAHQAMLSVIQEQTSLIEQLAGQVAAVKAQLNELAGGQNRISDRLDAEMARTGDLLHHTSERLDSTGERLNSTGERLIHYEGQLASYSEQLLAYKRASDAAREASDKQILQLRAMQLANERRVAELTSAAPGEPLNSQPVAPAGTQIPGGDNLYLLLEDQFRGTREDIKSRLVKYLPYLQAAESGTSDTPILDLGCGRCEWLELLRDHGLVAAGIDLNRTFVSYGQELGLDVTPGDAIAGLQQRPHNSLGCVTGFHIVEHLPWPVLVDLVDAAVRALKPGGLVIFETPNPDNVQVGSKNFYFDPTHRNPIPALLLKFLLDARGLHNIEILHIHPYPESMRLPSDGLAINERFNEFFYGPQDYAVIGRKP